MYLTETTRPGPNGTLYRCVLLRPSYREGGKGNNRTLANLSHCTPQEVEAIRVALQHKAALAVLGPWPHAPRQEGRSVGAVWVISEMARRVGIEAALGTDVAGQCALGQVSARVIDQGARLSAGRLAQTHAACEVLHLTRGFDAHDLSDNLPWWADNQGTMERRLGTARRGDCKPTLFLYAITRRDREGQGNAFAAFGDTRDGKAGKKPGVMGLLCDEEGTPVSVEVWAGNTPDMATVAAHMTKVAQRFACARVPCVGERGMLKSRQMEAWVRAGFHALTALTQPPVERLLKDQVLHLALLTAQVCAGEQAGLRYIVRRHPLRAEEMAAVRCDKQRTMEQWVAKNKASLAAHRRAPVAVVLRECQTQRARLQMAHGLTGAGEERPLGIRVHAEAHREAAQLAGWYVRKTDLPQAVAGTTVVPERDKDLALVAQALRPCKTAHLAVRPVDVRTAASTRGHALVVMFASSIMRALRQAWAHLALTVEEGSAQLATLCVIEVQLAEQETVGRSPKPRASAQRLLAAVGIHLPAALRPRKVRVGTRKQRPERRKKRKTSTLSTHQTST